MERRKPGKREFARMHSLKKKLGDLSRELERIHASPNCRGKFADAIDGHRTAVSGNPPSLTSVLDTSFGSGDPVAQIGSKQLRNRFEMRNWQNVRDMIGDAFTDSLRRIRYCTPTADPNRSRWPIHGLWRQFEDVIGNDLLQNCAGVLPSEVITANRTAKMRELDAQLSGLFVTRAAISDVSAGDFEEFMEGHVEALWRLINEHPVPVEERIAKARDRYRLS